MKSKSLSHLLFAGLAIGLTLGCSAAVRDDASIPSSVEPPLNKLEKHDEFVELVCARHPVAGFRQLLPASDQKVGEVWELDVASVLPVLAHLHPGVTARLRHVPPAVEGGRAVLLSSDESAIEMLFRVHVEFELVPREMYLLPAQFEGHLVWDRDRDRPKSFHLALPPRNTNFDLAYARSIDIGYIPRMDVRTRSASAAPASADAALIQLQRAFYPSARIDWLTLEEALTRAKSSGRRLHVMQLFGTLNDESC